MRSMFDAATKQVGVEPIPAPATVTGDPWIGRRIGNYVVDRALARGGMGAVYVARHPHLGREVAVKFLAPDVGGSPEIGLRFLSEARVTASLTHRNIVEILDFGEADGALYYVMELLRGKSLRGVMRERGKLTGAEMMPYAEQICAALEAAHAAGIVHRDLKPANVLVLEGEPLRLKLLDFGIAKLLSSGPNQTRHGQVLGTATHMAPEQALGDAGRVTPQSDLYSLGAILYEMLAGQPVFHHDSDVMLMVMHVRDEVPPLRAHAPDIPEGVARLVEKCLAKSPADRPTSARALAGALAEALRNPTTPARSPSPAATENSPVLADQPTRLASKPPAAPAPPPAAAFDRTQASPAAPAAAPPSPDSPAPVADRRTPAEPGRGVVTADATIETLTARLQRRGDFPAFARTVGEVSAKADANGAFSAGQLGESILKDYALTAKLLRIVNATYARRFGGRIYSIQHAIVILGFDRVRSLALSISLFKTSGSGKGTDRASESAISALVSSEIARNLASHARVNEDEATVSAMFKNLGRHLVLVHMPERYDAIVAEVEGGAPVALAARRALGLSFGELGAAMAKSWRLPEPLVNAMSAPDAPKGKLERSAERVTALASFANQVCDVVTREPPAKRDRAIRDLLTKFEALVNIDSERLTEILKSVEAALQERYASLLGNELKSSRFVLNTSMPPVAARAPLEKGTSPKKNPPRPAPTERA
ncbi:MAG TPA: HDOD domain-containing protein, partial [Polyangiaceae bacterium]|nr:HDOD domain-containing protein [Polyangiaceae bacterium]